MKNKKIFIVHGWTYSLNRWEILLTELESLGFTPVMLNVPGLSVPSDDIWDVPKYVEWLRGSIKDEKDPLVVGHSNGGRISMAYDVAFPGHIKHQFLIASAGIHHSNKSLGAKRLVAKGVAKVLRPVVKGRLRHVLYRAIGATDYGNATENMRETIQNVLEHDKTFDPSGVTARTSLIWGADDQATPLEDARMLEQKIQNFNDIIVFQGVKHSPHADVPKEVAKFIETRSKEER